MKTVDKTSHSRDTDRRVGLTSDAARRKALVREVVAGAILPGLLARKDAGVFDRPPNVIRLPRMPDDM